MSKIEWTEKTWEEIPNFEGYYASKDGHILSLKDNTNPIVLKPLMEKKNRHLYVYLYDGSGNSQKMYLHRLVLMAWVGLPKEGQVGRHLNDIPQDNRLENLSWGSVADNMADKIRNGGQTRGENHPSHRLTEKKVIEIRKRYAMGESSRTLSEEYGISHTNILEAVRGKSWKHLPTFPRVIKHSSAPRTPMTKEQKEKMRQGIIKYFAERKAKRVYDLVPCACGCGRMIETPDKKGRKRRYIKGHYNYWKHGKD